MNASGDLATDGAQLFKAALRNAELELVAGLFGSEPIAGRRLAEVDLAPVAPLLAPSGSVGKVAAQLIGDKARPVRAVAFDKSQGMNWRLGWHQDRVISVRRRIDVEGFTAWSQKSGQHHVQPPIQVVARMLTLRLHVDSVTNDNAPLQILIGSHRLGRLTDGEVRSLARDCTILACLADPGDVWAYSTPLVHRSAEQRQPGRRRVLQLDYSADELPGGLEWQQLI